MYKPLVVCMLLISGLVSCTGNDNGGNGNQVISSNSISPRHKSHTLNVSASQGGMFISADADIDSATAIPAGLKFNDSISAFDNNDNKIPNYNKNVAWQSSKADTVSIDRQTGFAFAQNPGNTNILATDLTNRLSDANQTLEVVKDSLDDLSISTPNMIELPINTSEQLDVTGEFHTLGNFDVTKSVHWTSSNEAIVHIVDDIKSPGLVEAVAPNGSATITATWSYNGVTKSDSILISVSNAKLKTIQLRPSQIIINHAAPQGVDLDYKAIGYYDDGHVYDITKQVHWDIDNHGKTPLVAVSLGAGRIETLSIGSVDIIASLQDAVARTSIAVNNATPKAIYISPIKAIGQAALVKGSRLAFKAIGIYSDGSVSDITRDVRWIPSQPSVIYIGSGNAKTAGLAIARKVSSGVPILINAKKWNILSNSYSLVSEPDDLKNLQISPANQTVYKGIAKQYNALSYDGKGYMIDMTDSLTWNIQPKSAGSFSQQIKGLFIPRQDGKSTVAANFPLNPSATDQAATKISKNYVVGVSITNDGDNSVAKGTAIYLHALAKLNNGIVIDVTHDQQTNWTSSDMSIVDYAGSDNATKGQFIARAKNNAKITVTFNNPIDNSVESATLDIEVKNKNISYMQINPVNLDMIANTRYKFTAVLSDNTTNYPVKSLGVVRWSSSDNNALSIDPLTGVAKAGASAKEGVVITATLEADNTISAQAIVNIITSKLQGLSITPPKTSLEVGDSQTYQAYAIYTNPVIKKLLNSPDQVHWSIKGDITKARINDDGKLIALSQGRVEVQAQLVNNGQLVTTPGAITTIPVEITDPTQDPLVSLEIIANDNQPLAIDEQRSYKVIAHYAHHDDVNLDVNNISWSSDNPTVATINSLPNSYQFGRVTANNKGYANIKATLINDPTKSATVKVDVDDQQKPQTSTIIGPIRGISKDKINFYVYANYSRNGELAKAMVDMSKFANWTIADNGSFGTGDYNNQLTFGEYHYPLSPTAYMDNNVFAIGYVGRYSTTVIENLVIGSVGTDLLHAGDTKDYHLKEFYNDIGNNDVTDGAIWLVEDSSKASIDVHGRLTALSAGHTNIIAYYNGIEVTKKPIDIISKPVPNSLNKVWLVDTMHNKYKVDTHLTMVDKSAANFYLMAEFNDGVVQKINPELVKWNSSAPAKVSFIQGRAVALAKGSSDIELSATYTYNGQSVTTPKVLVSIPSNKLTRLAITNAPESLVQNSTYNFTATGYFGDQDKVGAKLITGFMWKMYNQLGSGNMSLDGKVNVYPGYIYSVLKLYSLEMVQYDTKVFSIITGASATLTGITLESSDVTLNKINQSYHFKLIAHYANPAYDHYIDNSEVIWTSNIESRVNIDMNGDAVLLSDDKGSISASYKGKTATATINLASSNQLTITSPVDGSKHPYPFDYFDITGNGSNPANFLFYTIKNEQGECMLYDCDQGLILNNTSLDGTWSTWGGAYLNVYPLKVGKYTIVVKEYPDRYATKPLIAESEISFNIVPAIPGTLNLVPQESSSHKAPYTFVTGGTGQPGYDIDYSLTSLTGFCSVCTPSASFTATVSPTGYWSTALRQNGDSVFKDLPVGDYQLLVQEKAPHEYIIINTITRNFSVIR